MKNNKIVSKVLCIILSVIATCFCFVGCNDVPPAGDGNGDGDTVTITELTVYRMPNQTEYELGEEFNPTGLVFIAVMSDGTKKAVSPLMCQASITGVIPAGTTKVTFTYEGVSVDVPITVSGTCVHTYALVSIARKTKYVVGETFYEPFKKHGDYPVKAICGACGKEGEITSCTVSSEAMTLATTSLSVTATVGTREVTGSIPVSVYESKERFEPEKYIQAATDDANGTAALNRTKTYMLFDASITTGSGEQSKATKVYNDSTTGIAGVELGEHTLPAYLELHYFAKEAGEYELVVATAYTNVINFMDTWYATQTADAQINKFMAVTVNGKACSISNAMIIRGAGKNDGVNRHVDLINRATYISLGKVTLKAGENVIKIAQSKVAEYVDKAASTTKNKHCAKMRIDAIELYKD